MRQDVLDAQKNIERIASAANLLDETVEGLRMLNETDQPTRSRHLSLAITYAEDAANRMNNALQEAIDLKASIASKYEQAKS